MLQTWIKGWLCACLLARRGSATDSATNLIHALTAPGVTNFFALGPRIYSGSAPANDAAFAALQDLGVRTIITVDGTQPNVEAAARHGLRYVHLPFGYDGVPKTNLLQLVKAAQELPTPIFVHCHHGQHRGPTAAALLCEAVEGWTPVQATTWLHLAGTATNYPGLYRAVSEFQLPTVEALQTVSADFPARAVTGRLIGGMVQVDGHFDTLKAMAKIRFAALPEHPDLTAANEALQILEFFHEATRQKLGADFGETFLTALGAAEANANELYNRLQELEAAPSPGRIGAAQAAVQHLAGQCASCHHAFRDHPR